MKPLLKLSVLLLVTFFTFSFAQAQSPNVKIIIETEIGHKPKPECPGFGLCYVKVTIELKPTSSGTAVVSNWTYNSDSRSIQWEIQRNELASRNPSKLKYFDNQRMVTFETDEVLPQDVSDAMGIKGGAVIKAGSYPLSYNPKLDLFIISMTVDQTTD